MNDNLPPLPESSGLIEVAPFSQELAYTSEQMREYGQLCRQMEKAFGGFRAAISEKDAALKACVEAFDQIGGLCRALRAGGPAPEDLEGLSDALQEAVDTAHAAITQCQEALK